MTKTELLEDFISYLFTEEYITDQQLHTIVDVPKQYIKERTKINNLDIQSVNESCCINAVEIIQTLQAYGMIHTIEGVVYPQGSHREMIDKAKIWLHNYRKL